MRSAADDPSVVTAAQWLADQADFVPSTITVLRERFGITVPQAAQACTLANKMRTLRRAHS